MTAKAKHLIEEFRALPDETKREVLAEILSISREIEYPEITDEDLRHAAEKVFLMMDAEEQRE